MRLTSPRSWLTPSSNAHAHEPHRTQIFANIRADLRAHGGDWGAFGFWALLVYRFGRWRYGVRPVWLRKIFSAVYKVMFKLVQIVTGICLPCEVAIGRNFIIDHHGGIVISGFTRFGDNCRIRNGVTVGLSRADEPCAPVIGNNVDIGAGAKVLGRIMIGDDVFIGANAVVVRDVPSNCIAVGVPAVVKRRSVGTTSGTRARPARTPGQRNFSSVEADAVPIAAVGTDHGVLEVSAGSKVVSREMV